MKLELFDLLDKEPIVIDGVGTLKPPTLREIKKLGDLYNLYVVLLLIHPKDYIKTFNLSNVYLDINTESLTIFDLIEENEDVARQYLSLFSFFFIEEVVFNKIFKYFILRNRDSIVGYIDKNNFEDIRNCIAQLNYLKTEEELKQPKFKGKKARQIAETIAKAKERSKKDNQNILELTLAQKISKYCADNKNGINLLNVFDMTVYQFYNQFIQHNYIKQCDLQNAIYANTVNITDIKTFDPNLWLK